MTPDRSNIEPPAVEKIVAVTFKGPGIDIEERVLYLEALQMVAFIDQKKLKPAPSDS